jgi:hypothetical protein
MSKVKVINQKKDKWEPFVEIQLSKAEAARLVALLGAEVGNYRNNTDLYVSLVDAFGGDRPSSNAIFDTNEYSQEAKRWINSQGEI